MQRGIRHDPEPFALWPEVGVRAGLQTDPDETAVASWVMTRAAERAWQAINRALGRPGGALFFIGGPPGSGKTHFLNYVIALQLRAGSLENEAGRHLMLALEADDGARPAALESRILEQIAAALAVNRRTGLLWRQMRGGEAFKVALDQARRMGARAVTLALDLKGADCAPLRPTLVQLAELATSTHAPRLLAIAAGRGRVPAGLDSFVVAPADSAELSCVAVGRARRLTPHARQHAAAFYRGIEADGCPPDAIFPFHPAALELLAALANPPGSVAALAALAREALYDARTQRSGPGRLLMPCDLMESRAIASRIEARLGENGRAAFKIASDAAAAAGEDGARTAGSIVATLMLESLAGRSPILSIAELHALIPRDSGDGLAPGAVTKILSAVEARAGGVIRSDSSGVRFDPRAAGAPEVAAFNAALALAHRFDPALSAARERPELAAKLKRLSDAMAGALEAAHRMRASLRLAFGAAHRTPPPENERAFAAFVALAEAGPAALIDAGGDPDRRAQAEASIGTYMALAEAAAALPRAAGMTEYIGRTGLEGGPADGADPAGDARVAALAAECHLLRAELDPAALTRASRNLEAIEARFQKFRWTYAELYRGAHRKWREETEVLAGRFDDLRRHLEALARLNSIAALGAPLGEELADAAAVLGARISSCDFRGKLEPQSEPRCPGCGYLLGSSPPAREIGEIFERTLRALRKKLAALSQSTILRIIREHDRNRRLEGFLKITQAAQTEALIKVFDDRLAAYLARLLEENLSGAETVRALSRPAHLKQHAARLVRHKPSRG